eukprot:466114-Pyramimonas_sp.AAC.1
MGHETNGDVMAPAVISPPGHRSPGGRPRPTLPRLLPRGLPRSELWRQKANNNNVKSNPPPSLTVNGCRVEC